MSWADMSPLVGDLAMGGLAGYSVGYFAKKFFKIVAVITGGYLASLIYLSSRGYLTVNWAKITESTNGILSKILGLNLSVGVMGTGAVAGFLLGWKSG